MPRVISTDTVRDLRDRALIGVMTYAFARIGAVVSMRVEDYFANGKRWWVRLHEKGGKRHEMPAQHKLEAFLDEYIRTAGIAGDERGFLNSGSPGGYAPYVAAFRQGLKETSYVEGQNVAIEYRWAEGQYDRAPAMAAELVRRQVVVIVANSPGVMAVKAATTTIPIVFTTATDPVKIGLVASLSRPGGNVTGVTQLNVEVEPKRLQLMHELVPTATIIAVLVNPTYPTGTDLRDLQAAARTLGLQLHVLHASTERDFDTVFATLVQLRAGALVISNDAFFFSQSEQLAALALRHAVPAIYWDHKFAAAGGLMSHGGSTLDIYRIAGTYTGRILKGERPSDLPVQQATKLELLINLKTAKVLGLTIPETLLATANEVIE